MSPSKVTKISLINRAPEVESKLESIYIDLNNVWKAYLTSPNTYIFCDPYDSFRRCLLPCRSCLRRTFRYGAAHYLLGSEYVAIAMHSPNFLAAMESSSDYIWHKLIERISENKNSIRMFAIMRHIPYVEHYDNSPFFDLLGPLPERVYSPPPHQGQLQANHPHEVYLTTNGDIARCMIKEKKINNITENNYLEARFLEYPQAAEWPADWPYPRDPTICCAEPSGLFSTCEKCFKLIKPGQGSPPWVMAPAEYCRCMPEDIFTEPLVEVREYPPYPGDPSLLNRGVRTLTSIREGDILGEYLGDIYPKNAEDEIGDETYLFDIFGPFLWPDYVGGGRDGKVAVLTAAKAGNWTRFLNHREGGSHNVEFQTRVIGYRFRILAVARRNIRGGEELTVSYGNSYFMKEDSDSQRENEDESEEDCESDSDADPDWCPIDTSP